MTGTRKLEELMPKTRWNLSFDLDLAAFAKVSAFAKALVEARRKLRDGTARWYKFDEVFD